jgi:hypothetical protein
MSPNLPLLLVINRHWLEDSPGLFSLLFGAVGEWQEMQLVQLQQQSRTVWYCFSNRLPADNGLTVLS